MQQRLILLLSFLLLAILDSTAAGDKIKVYFNTQVDTSFARNGNNATFLDYRLDDTLIAYINRAQHTLDIAVYQFSQGSGMRDVAAAINSAYGRGVTVRFIYDGEDSSSTSIGQLNAGIRTLPSPNSSAYNIMHNKFMVIDAGYPADATVWSGSTNWTESMFHRSPNNTVIIQDQPLARAYVAEFEQMWGSTTATPNPAASKFGPFKSPSATHTFTIDGKTVELYFSPQDNTNTQIRTAIGTADKELYFGVYTFTEANDANDISAKYATTGMTVKGIMDDFSISYNAYGILSPVMGSDLKIFNQGGKVYHNKMLIVDPSYPSSDPLVLTGSHNWSVTANTTNDENTLIIHDSTIANEYLQSFAANFKALGGFISPTTGIDILADGSSISLYPNPVQDRIFIDIEPSASELSVEFTDISGHALSAQSLVAGHNELSTGPLAAGIYLVKISTSATYRVYRITKL